MADRVVSSETFHKVARNPKARELLSEISSYYESCKLCLKEVQEGTTVRLKRKTTTKQSKPFFLRRNTTTKHSRGSTWTSTK